jgi:hypothetical protein
MISVKNFTMNFGYQSFRKIVKMIFQNAFIIQICVSLSERGLSWEKLFIVYG